MDMVRTEEELVGSAGGGEDGRLRPRRHRATTVAKALIRGANEQNSAESKPIWEKRRLEPARARAPDAGIFSGTYGSGLVCTTGAGRRACETGVERTALGLWRRRLKSKMGWAGLHSK